MPELHHLFDMYTGWGVFAFLAISAAALLIIAGIIPWVAIVVYVWAPRLDASPPAFIYGIVVSLFVFFNCFAVNMILQYKNVGAWRAYLYGEKVYILLSLTAKALLTWQLFFPVLMSS